MREGKEAAEIRAYIDAEYSQYGPSTDTEAVPGDKSQGNCGSETAVSCGDTSTEQTPLIDAGDMSQITVPREEK